MHKGVYLKLWNVFMLYFLIRTWQLSLMWYVTPFLKYLWSCYKKYIYYYLKLLGGIFDPFCHSDLLTNEKHKNYTVIFLAFNVLSSYKIEVKLHCLIENDKKKIHKTKFYILFCNVIIFCFLPLVRKSRVVIEKYYIT